MKLTRAVRSKDQSVNSDLILELHERDSLNRPQVEDFIHQVFTRAYGADLKQYLPHLMGLRDNQNRIIAALGMRNASSGSLFLESYLDSSIEKVITELNGSPVAREQIMEVGNLASIHRGGMRQLIVALTSFLTGAEIEWVVFTAVPAVRNAFAALGLNLHTIADADISRLSEQEQSIWGRYYDTGPVVVAGRVEEGYQRLGELIELEKVISLSWYLWQNAFAAGAEQRTLNTKSATKLKGVA